MFEKRTNERKVDRAKPLPRRPPQAGEGILQAPGRKRLCCVIPQSVYYAVALQPHGRKKDGLTTKSGAVPHSLRLLNGSRGDTTDE